MQPGTTSIHETSDELLKSFLKSIILQGTLDGLVLFSSTHLIPGFKASHVHPLNFLMNFCRNVKDIIRIFP